MINTNVKEFTTH